MYAVVGLARCCLGPENARAATVLKRHRRLLCPAFRDEFDWNLMNQSSGGEGEMQLCECEFRRVNLRRLRQ